jgi:protein kinase C substrate 80K-H
MNYQCLFSWLTVQCLFVQAIDPIRGVTPDDLVRYQPDENGNWHCLSNPEIILTIDQVNDNYCDCPDGSDEPGTSACENGMFYCENQGFKPHYIPTYKVDDGICDYDVCCDGSDEDAGLCENRCHEMKIEYDLEIKKHNQKISDGLILKNKILDKSKLIKNQLIYSVDKFKNEITEIERKIGVLELERNKLDKDQELIVNNFQTIETDLNSLSINLFVSFTKLNDYIEKLESLEDILKIMTDQYNHNFNDPAVKQAAQEYLNFAAAIEDFDTNTSKRIKVNEIINNFQKDFDYTKEEINRIKSEILSLKFEKPKLIKSESSFSSFLSKAMNILTIGCEQLVSLFLGIESHIRPMEEEEKQFTMPSSSTDINGQINVLKSRLDTINLELKKTETELANNYGPDDILRSMTDCIFTTIGDYKYKFCPTSILEQINKENRGTKIGIFDEIKYSEQTKNYELFFNGGERCWNGPIRKAVVDIVCDVDLKILSVTEPEKCIYQFKVSSPIGCFESDLL